MIHGYSGSNPRIRGLRRLARDRSQRYEKRSFIVEGPGLVAEALDVGLDVRLVVVPESPLDDLNAGPALDALLRRALATGADVGTVPDSVFDGLTSTGSPQPALAEVGFVDVDMDVLFAGVEPGHPLLVLVGLADPGNVGTLFRSAEAFGAAGLCLVGGVDPYNPKLVRAAAGSAFRIPFSMVGDDGAVDVLHRLAEAEVAAWATMPSAGASMAQVAATDGLLALVLGNEPHGLSDDVVAACVGTATVETSAGMESLNVAVAGSVALYELSRTG